MMVDIQVVIAIDPGPTNSAVVVVECMTNGDEKSFKIENAFIGQNDEVREKLSMFVDGYEVETIVIEKIESYGMPVGRDVFETVEWVGRIKEAFEGVADIAEVTRREVKLELCNSARAKDANVRQALIDRVGKPGTKNSPGPTYGVKSHLWAALGVAVTFFEKNSGGSIASGIDQ